MLKKSINMTMPWVILSVTGALIASVGSYLLRLTEGLILQSTVEMISQNILEANTFIIFIALVFGSLFLSFIGSVINFNGSIRIRRRLQVKLVDHWLHEKESVAEKRHSGDSITRMTSDIDIVEQFYFQGIHLKIIHPIGVGILAIITVGVINLRLAIVSMVISVFAYFISGLILKTVAKLNDESRSADAVTTQTFSEMLSANRTIRLFNLQNYLLNQYANKCSDYANKVFRVAKWEIGAEFVSKILELAALVSFIGVGWYLSQAGTMQFTDILLVLPMQTKINTMLSSISPARNYITQYITSAKRVFDALDTEQEDKNLDKQDLLPQDQCEFIVEMNNINFSYDDRSNVLNNICLQVKEGETVAIIGESGSGKSTLFQVLLGLYKASGTLKCFGVNFEDCKLSSWRRQFVYVRQEAHLLDKSIAENIAIGAYTHDDNPSQEVIENAAKAAGAHEFIMKLPLGYSTSVGESSAHISGGQRQRIALASAFISKAPIILLDEPTSAVDAESESIIQNSLEKLAQEKTVIIIAHRLNTIENADAIYSIEQGHMFKTK